MKRSTIYLMTGCISLLAGVGWLTKPDRTGQLPSWMIGSAFIITGVLWLLNYIVRRKSAAGAKASQVQ